MKISNRQAVEAQMVLPILLPMNLPVKISLAIASLSTEIDRQVKTFATVRDSLIKNYKIKISQGEKSDEVKFDTEMNDRNVALKEFTDKVNELMELEGDDIQAKIPQLPDEVNIKGETLKPIIAFLEV